MNSIQTKLQQQFPDIAWKFNWPLKNQTYFKIGGSAEIYAELTDLEQIRAIVKFCHEQDLKLTVLGGASNVIISDAGINGVVLKILNLKFEINPDMAGATIIAGAGLKMAELVKKTLDQHLTGLEYFLGVPGTLGGAVLNNAHYSHHLIGEFIDHITVIDPAGQVTTVTQSEANFAYDQSRFQISHEIIWEVTFKLKMGDSAASAQLVKESVQHRASTQPLNLPSSGCTFKNVPNSDHLRQLFPQFANQAMISAGFLIDQAGLKNKRIGDIAVSDKHAAFLVNLGNGTATDALALVKLVQDEVFAKFGVHLETEVFLLT